MSISTDETLATSAIIIKNYTPVIRTYTIMKNSYIIS